MESTFLFSALPYTGWFFHQAIDTKHPYSLGMMTERKLSRTLGPETAGNIVQEHITVILPREKVCYM